jgi:hypothetical protein
LNFSEIIKSGMSLLQSEFLNLSNYKTIGEENRKKGMAEENDNFSSKEKFMTHLDKRESEQEESFCQKIFCNGFNLVILSGISLCLLILFILLILAK